MGFYKEPSTWRPFDLRVVTYNCIFFFNFFYKVHKLLLQDYSMKTIGWHL